MAEKIMFVDSSDSFLVKSVIKELTAEGFSCKLIEFEQAALEENKGLGAEVVVTYVDDPDDVDEATANALKSLCAESNAGLYFMGKKADVEDLKDTYSIDNVAGEFLRPINASDVAAKISQLVDADDSSVRKHILVVDDSGIMLNTIQEWLGEKYRVSVTNSAMNALGFLDDENNSIPDVILLDYEMPGCSGPELFEMLKGNARTKDIPVIFLTGKDDPDSVKLVLSLNPAGYLLKSMPKEYIVDQVDTFFAEHE